MRLWCLRARAARRTAIGAAALSAAALHAVADPGSCSGGPSSPACLGVQREAGTTVAVTG